MKFYIHMPFCVRKCLYCDFYSSADISRSDEYASAVLKEAESYRGCSAETIYIGGGPPTAAPNALLKIIDGVTDMLSLTADCEFTVEANPGTVTSGLLKSLKGMGVNRLSLGAQSFNGNELRALGRIHSAADIFAAADAAHNAGFENISIDIMLATPLQTPGSLSHTIDCALSLDVPHVSAYSLIIEENTPFYNMELSLPDDDTEREMYYMLRSRLAEKNIMQYEISNFAKKGFESRHNSAYWRREDYIGLGAAAHSCVGAARFANAADTDLYISGEGCRVEEVRLSAREIDLERFMLGLRMTEGIEYNGEFPERVKPLIKKGLLEKSGSRLRLTNRGIDLGNLVFMEFLDD